MLLPHDPSVPNEKRMNERICRACGKSQKFNYHSTFVENWQDPPNAVPRPVLIEDLKHDFILKVPDRPPKKKYQPKGNKKNEK